LTLTQDDNGVPSTTLLQSAIAILSVRSSHLCAVWKCLKHIIKLCSPPWNSIISFKMQMYLNT